jgi:hypothetical protein
MESDGALIRIASGLSVIVHIHSGLAEFIPRATPPQRCHPGRIFFVIKHCARTEKRFLQNDMLPATRKESPKTVHHFLKFF